MFIFVSLPLHMVYWLAVVAAVFQHLTLSCHFHFCFLWCSVMLDMVSCLHSLHWPWFSLNTDLWRRKARMRWLWTCSWLCLRMLTSWFVDVQYITCITERILLCISNCCWFINALLIFSMLYWLTAEQCFSESYMVHLMPLIAYSGAVFKLVNNRKDYQFTDVTTDKVAKLISCALNKTCLLYTSPSPRD